MSIEDDTRTGTSAARAGVLAGAALVLVFFLVSSLVASQAVHRPRSGVAEQSNRGAQPAPDPLRPIVERYAPVIFAETAPCGGRQDIISNIDFDGDLVGSNNWDNFERFELRPTVYYALLETETHYFLSFHLFHPRDWSSFPVGLNDTHENDGENFQVVVRKRDERVVLLWTQAHYRGRVHTIHGSGIASGRTRITGSFQTLDSAGLPSETGTHACVFVESEGHGVYSTLDGEDVRVNGEGSYRFKSGGGLVFRAARADEVAREPRITRAGEAPYQLDSITLKLWPLLRDGHLTGDGKLLDGAYRYRDGLVDIREVPRYYDASRWSGPLGSDRGISPFALDFSFSRGTLGALFFNPAKRYAERLEIADPWSFDYIDYPYAH